MTKNKEECCVCFKLTSDRLTPCEHAVCASCMTSWMARSFTCPMCRQPPCGHATTAAQKNTICVIPRATTVDHRNARVYFASRVVIALRPPRRHGGRPRISVVQSGLRLRRCELVHAVNGFRVSSVQQVLQICHECTVKGCNIFFDVSKGSLLDYL